MVVTSSECPVCDGSHPFTADAWHDGTICTGCGSDVRHRLLAAVLLRALDVSSLLRRRILLHVGPERSLARFFRRHQARSVAADLRSPDGIYLQLADRIDLLLDLTQAPVVSAAVDVVIACDVLEHVLDDYAALREVRRVLSPRGCAFVTVPQPDDALLTDEDPTVVSAEERLRRFAQEDHVRMYGADIVTRFEQTGFRVETFAASSFPEDLVRRWVLRPPRPSPRPLATNSRRVYLLRPV